LNLVTYIIQKYMQNLELGGFIGSFCSIVPEARLALDSELKLGYH